jgi:CRISPR/Cas system CMR-associated protein Cmr5 small subunit
LKNKTKLKRRVKLEVPKVSIGMIEKEHWLAKDKVHKVELKNNSMNERMKKQEIDLKQITEKIKLL